MSNSKPWRCEKGHVLGLIRGESVSKVVKGAGRVNYRTNRLLIYRHAIDMTADAPEDVDVAGSLDDFMLLGFTWKCSICGVDRLWHPDEEALSWLRLRVDGGRAQVEGQRSQVEG